MDDKMKKLMQKHSGKEIDPEYKRAKMSMLEALRSSMEDMMKEDLKGHSMKKVSVMAPDSEGLKEGLEKAEEIVEGPESEEEASEESSELSEEEASMLEKLLAKSKASKI